MAYFYDCKYFTGKIEKFSVSKKLRLLQKCKIF